MRPRQPFLVSSIALFLATIAHCPPAVGQLFAPGVRYAAGDIPVAIASGDLNGDEARDLVTANIASNDLSVLLNRGDGTFAPQVRYPMDFQPRVLAIGDVDGDGHQDIAVGRQSDTATLAIHWGDGDGTVGSTNAIGDFTGFPDGVRLADLDQDEDLDVIVGSVLLSTIVVWINSGDRTFETEVLYDLQMDGGYPADFAVGDLDRDADLDIVTAGTLSMSPPKFLLNDGSGVFGAPIPYTVEIVSVVGVDIADLDRDGFGDIAALDFSSGSIDAYRNDGAPSFLLTGTYPVGSTATLGGKVRLGDLNLDGFMDAVIALAVTNPAVPVLLGNGSGGFGAPTSYAADPSISSVELADLDGDLDLDIAAPSRELDSVVILRNQSASPSEAGDSSSLLGFGLRVMGPNPMTERVSILYQVPRTTRVDLTIHDVAGRLIRTLIDRDADAGEHGVEWNGRATDGSLVEPGVYFYRMSAGNFASRGKIQVVPSP